MRSVNSDHLTDSLGRQWVLGPVLGRGSWGRSRVIRDVEGREMVLKEPLTGQDFPSDAPLPEELLEACKTCALQQIAMLEEGTQHFLPRLESTMVLPSGRVGLVVPRYATLERKLESGVPLVDLLRLVYRIALTLAETQTIHGNLRPSNVVFGERGEAFLTDLATRALAPHHGRLLDLAGHSAWMPPEARGRPTAKPSSIWDTWALCQLIHAVLLLEPREPRHDHSGREHSGRGEPERKLVLPLVPGGLDKIAVTHLKDAVQARLVAEGTNPRFRGRVGDRLGALLARGLSPEHEPSPPYRFATARDFADRVNEVLALLRPRVVEIGKVLFPANAADGIFRHGTEISFSVTVGCTHGITDHDDLVCGLQLVDLDAPDPQSPEARKPVEDARLKLQVHPSGRLRFQLTIPEIPPGRFRVRVAFAIKDSGDEPQVAVGDLEVRPPPGYVPPKQEGNTGAPLPFRGQQATGQRPERPVAKVRSAPAPEAPAPAPSQPAQLQPAQPQATSTGSAILGTPRIPNVARPAPPAEPREPHRPQPEPAGVVVGLFPRPVRPPDDELEEPTPSRSLKVVQPEQSEPSEAVMSSAPSSPSRIGQPPRADAPPAAFRADTRAESRPEPRLGEPASAGHSQSGDSASNRRSDPPNDSFRAVSLSPMDPSELTVPAPDTWPPPTASRVARPGPGAPSGHEPTPEPASVRSSPIPLRRVERLPPPASARSQSPLEDPPTRPNLGSHSQPDDLPSAGDDLPGIVGLPRPPRTLPAPLAQLVELVRSDTYVALGAAIAASLVLLLVTTAVLKAC
jgi:hypothetical protein